tara:strand:- start:524 stop:760 length:237 start_codon:yes stop_codon:yes gene_type:complete
MDIQDIQMQLDMTIESCIESIHQMGMDGIYDEWDFPDNDRKPEQLVDMIANYSGSRFDIDFEVGYLKGLETALRIVMR